MAHTTSLTKFPASGLETLPLSVSRNANRNETGDAGDRRSTATTVDIGDSFGGTITSGDVDFLKVKLAKGEYVFYVYGAGGNNAGLSDTRLTVYKPGPDGRITSNDNVDNDNKFSLVELSVAQAGTYYIEVGGQNGQTGDYVLQTSDDTFSAEQVANYLIRFDWGEEAALRFGVQTGNTIEVNLTELNADGKQLARWALDAWGTATGIAFQEVSSGGEILFDDSESGAFAGPQAYSPANGINSMSTVNVGTDWIASYGTSIDSYSFQTYL
ncbi:MAG: hypothetical protein WA989_03935, partial [Henriciella sp.]